MIQQKHFKSRVRERMQKTGESYSTARMRIDASRGSVPGLAPGYPSRNAVSQYDAGLWQRVLDQSGVENPVASRPFSEAMLAGLAGGIGFMVFTFEYKTVTTATVVTRFHPGPYVKNLIERCGADIVQESTTSASLAQSKLDLALAGGSAVVVKATRGALPWFATEALEFSDSVDVVVAGNDGGSYLIDDGGGTLRRADAAELASARARRKADKHWQAHVAGPGGLTAEGLGSRIRLAVAETALGLLGEDAPAGIPDRFSGNFGIPGMRTWAGRLRDVRTKKGWTTMFQEEKRLRPALGQLRTFLDASGWGGPGALRPLYAEFLEEAAGTKGLGGLGRVSTQYRALGARWAALAQLVDVSCPADQRTALFGSMAAALDGIIEAEETAGRALAEAVR
ncbi:DUF4872 domain-containing protein [Arthrobacter sp. H5]|uniref:DUF4872 domain-containing protein n=1 Tax=Arthrobacter sp. H5 TaxID=1267973 RepID=UPI0004857614|nr:DUF4872 domain-containing protein [Arthrobacter sp. H5]